MMSRTGKVKVFPIVGIIFMVIALLLLSRIGADTNIHLVWAYMGLFGLGLGNTMQPLTRAVQNAVSPREIGMATSAATFFRQIGGTLGVAVFLSVLLDSLPGNIADAFTSAAATPAFQQALKDPAVMADPTNAAFAKALGSGDTSVLSGLMNDTSMLGRGREADLDRVAEDRRQATTWSTPPPWRWVGTRSTSCPTRVTTSAEHKPARTRPRGRAFAARPRGVSTSRKGLIPKTLVLGTVWRLGWVCSFKCASAGARQADRGANDG